MLSRALAIMFFVATTAVAQTPVQVGASQVWVDLPNWTDLNTANDPDLSLGELEYSLDTAAAHPLNPDGLTLSGALDIATSFGDNLANPVPCDQVTIAIVGRLTDPSSASAQVVRSLAAAGTGCCRIEDNCFNTHIINQLVDISKNPFSPGYSWCVEVDSNGLCTKWYTTYPCNPDDPGCSCQLTVGGECVLWEYEPPGDGSVFPPPPANPPGIDPGSGGPPGQPPGNGGGGLIPPTSGGDPGEGGGGGGGGNAGVNSTVAGNCGGSGGGAGSDLGAWGAAQLTSNPVLRAEGFKHEQDADLIVDLPGRDFALNRVYSGTPLVGRTGFWWSLGQGWATSADAWAVLTPKTADDANPIADYIDVTLFPVHTSRRFYDTESHATGQPRVFKPGQSFYNQVGSGQAPVPSSSLIREATTTYMSETVNVWRLEAMGEGFSEFVRSDAGSLGWLKGRLIRQQDAAGNYWTYEYVRVENPGSQAAPARLVRILCNGNAESQADAVVRFDWDLGTSAQPGTGLLRGATVLRPLWTGASSVAMIPVQYVTYTYRNDSLDYVHHLGSYIDPATQIPYPLNQNALVLVEQGTLVNPPVVGESLAVGYLNQLKYHKRFTHYRYNQAVSWGGRPNGAVGLLTHTFDAGQLQYLAEQWAQREGIGNPNQDYRDAIEYILSLSLTDAVSDAGIAAELKTFSSKTVSYYGFEETDPARGFDQRGQLAFRVKEQIVREGCECGSGSGARTKHSYAYGQQRFMDGSHQTTIFIGSTPIQAAVWTYRDSAATVITEFVEDAQGNWIPDRRKYSWNEGQKLLNGWTTFATPNGGIRTVNRKLETDFTVANRVEELNPDGTVKMTANLPLAWNTVHRVSLDDLLRAQVYHPTSINDVSFDETSGLLIYTPPAASGFGSYGDVNALNMLDAFDLRSTEGLIEWYEYNNDGLLERQGVQRGDTGPFYKTKEYEFYPSSQVSGRKDLVRFEKTYPVAAGPATEVEYIYQVDTSGVAAARQVLSKTTRVARESAAENGPGGLVTIVEEFDNKGRPTVTTHADGSQTQRVYELSHNGLVHQSRNGTPFSVTKSSGPLEIETIAALDVSGTIVSATDETGVRVNTLRSLSNVEFLTPGAGGLLAPQQSALQYFTQTEVPHVLSVSPIKVAGTIVRTWTDADLRILRRGSYEASSVQIGGLGQVKQVGVGTERARAVYSYSPSGALRASREWARIDPLDPNSGVETTEYQYDARGRVSEVLYPTGRVVRNEYDGQDRLVREYAGQDGGAITLRKEIFFDHTIVNGEPASTAGNGSQTIVRFYPEPGSTSAPRDRVSVFDWRGRLRMTFTADRAAATPWETTATSGSAEIMLYDNIGRVTERATYAAGDHAGLVQQLEDDAVTSLESPLAGSLQRTLYSVRGLEWATDVAVNPHDLDDGFLRTQRWFDAAKRPVASAGPSGPVERFVYDGLGRPVTSALVDGQAARSSASFAEVAAYPGDHFVFSETTTAFDARNRPTLTATRVRTLGDPASTGVGSNPVATYAVTMFDDSSRQIASIQYGTNINSDDRFRSGGTAPGVPTTVPSRSDPAWAHTRISSADYDAAGQAYSSTDPEGRETRRFFDAKGRQFAVVENWSGTGVTFAWDETLNQYIVTARQAGTDDQNRATSYVFDRAGNTIKRVAHLRVAGAERVQVTEYVYDSAAGVEAGNPLGNLADTYGLLYAIKYPKPGTNSANPYSDPSAGQPSDLPENSTRFAYSFFGEQIAIQDQNGTRRAFERDGSGRVVAERVIHFGSSDVDTLTKQVTTDYDPFGRVERVSTWDSDIASPQTSGTADELTRVGYTYDNRGMLLAMSQIAAEGESPRQLAWEYETVAHDVLNPSGSNRFRLQSMEYPDGSKLLPVYGAWDGNPANQPTATPDSSIDRVREFWLQDPSGTTFTKLVTYDHIGTGTVVRADLGAFQVDRTADGSGDRWKPDGTGMAQGTYPGWDHFGRLKLDSKVHSLWGTSGSTPNFAQIEQTAYSYDRNSNKLSKHDLRLYAAEPDRDWNLAYDGLNRLVQADRGVFTQSPGVLAAGSRKWSLDALGNWTTTDTLNSGVWDDPTPDTTDAQFAHNATNERTHADGSEAYRYDHNGNRTQTLNAPARRFEYDAWNRLVRVRAGSTSSSPVLAEYGYNGLHWRTNKRGPSAAGNPLSPSTQRLMYYSPSWQILYEDVDSAFDGTHDTTSAGLQVWGKRHIDDALYRVVDDFGDGTHDRGFWYVTDALFSVVALLANNSIYERLSYDAYGVPRHAYPEDYSTPTGQINFFDQSEFLALYNAGDMRADLNFDGVLNFFDVQTMQFAFSKGTIPPLWISDEGPEGPDSRIGYAGYVWDAEIGMWLSRHRMYDPTTGRWMQRDPAGYVDGMSLYIYAMMSPFGMTDPTGLSPLVAMIMDEVCELVTGKDLGELSDDLNYYRWKGAMSVIDTITGDLGEEAISELNDGSEGTMRFVNRLREQGHSESARRTLLVGHEGSEVVSASYQKVADDSVKLLEESRDELYVGVITGGLYSGVRAIRAMDKASDIVSAAGVADDIFRAAPNRIATPYGVAVQDGSETAMAALGKVQQGALVYKGGVLGSSEAGASQFLALENPLSRGYASRYGIPPQNSRFDFIMGGRVRGGDEVITRVSPPQGSNPGGGIEAVVNPNSFIADWFAMP